MSAVESTEIAAAPVVLITGAARRIGAEITRCLHDAGWRVVLHCRDSRAEADALAAQCNATRSNSATVLQADLAVGGSAAALVVAAHAHWGRLDALVNNASSYRRTPLDTLTADDTEELLASNLKAPLEAMQALAGLESASAVVNIIDTLARRVHAGYAPYFAAKSGLWTLTEAIALELAPRIRVNGVAPGHILWATNSTLDGAAQATEMARIPMQRLGEVADIARAVRFLLSADAAYITGAILPVDGGLRLA